VYVNTISVDIEGEELIMLLYCDRCAERTNRPILEKKEKGTCMVCERVIGPMNIEGDDLLTTEQKTSKMGCFVVNELNKFHVGIKLDNIDKECATHRLLNSQMVVLFGKKRVVVANPTTGERVEISQV
jgi:hypothetical protein